MSIPRVRFAHLPTPIEELPELTKVLGGPRLFVKRDDHTGLAFGGNKTRKLEFLVAEAHEQGADMLISAGAIQSNHCRQTAAAAARFGFGCTLVLNGDSPELVSANYLLDQLFGAKIVLVRERDDRDRVLQETFENARATGRNPYLVPYGGSSATGVMGYTFAMEELSQQKLDVNWIIFGTSSGGTHAGLVLGKRLYQFKGKVLGISIDEPTGKLKTHVSTLAAQASEKFGQRIEFSPDEVFADDSYCQAGYGVFGDGEREAIHLFARHEGLLLDPVYTGRTAAGMVDLIRKGFFHRDDAVLFWHTGGHPALFADKYAQRLL